MSAIPGGDYTSRGWKGKLSGADWFLIVCFGLMIVSFVVIDFPAKTLLIIGIVVVALIVLAFLIAFQNKNGNPPEN